MYKDLVYDGNSLFGAFKRARENTAFKAPTQQFEGDLLFELAKLQKSLQKGTYKSGKKHEFILSERGKTRLIHSASFADKVFQHSLCDNVLTPILRKYLIYDNCASLPNKGLSLSRKRFRVHMQKYFNKYKTNEGYILLMDFSGYYDNLRHDLVLKELGKVIKDKWVLDVTKMCLDNFKQDVSFLSDEEIDKLYEGKYKALNFVNIPRNEKVGKKFMYKSLDIGDQCSQILGVYYPTRIDNYVKIVRSQKYYGRYVDDSYIISKSKDELIDLLVNVKKIAKEMGIILNSDKVRIVKLNSTFVFLQHKYFLTSSGKLVERVNPKLVTRERIRLKKFFAIKMPLKDIENNFKAWKGNYYHYMSKEQRKRMNKLYYSLKEGAINGR